MQNYIAMSPSLNSLAISAKPPAFPSGERGPRGAVNEESGICIAQYLNGQIYFNKKFQIPFTNASKFGIIYIG